jgi:hypothetical protein
MTSTSRDWPNVPPADYPQPLQIELAVTADDEIGARPPTIDDGTWYVVRSSGGATTWRRVYLE